MVAFTNEIKVGSSQERDVLLGPIQNEMQYEKVKQYFTESKSQGHNFVAGKQDVLNSKGYFVQPTIIDNPPSHSKLVTEEPFGQCKRSVLCKRKSRVMLRTCSSLVPIS